MKKVLSVLLAAAMVMGMSVSAAALSWGADTTTDIDGKNVNQVVELYPLAHVVFNGEITTIDATNDEELVLKPGSDIYFQLIDAENGGNYDGIVDKDWSINIKGNKYVAKASFYTVKETDTVLASAGYDAKDKLIKVELVDDLDSTSLTNSVKFEMYIADHGYANVETEHMLLTATFHNTKAYTVSYDFINDADEAAVWKAPAKKGTAIFDFNDDIYFTVNMISEESVVLNLSQAYDKDIDKAYNEYDADLSFYNFKGTKDAFTKTGELFIPADEDTFIYEIVDEEIVEIDATWTDEYTVGDVTYEYEGWVIETKELGYYVVADEELVVAEVETEVEATETVETEKANPETGAADFVGAAVALAVVSVAAAGALALKK